MKNKVFSKKYIDITVYFFKERGGKMKAIEDMKSETNANKRRSKYTLNSLSEMEIVSFNE